MRRLVLLSSFLLLAFKGGAAAGQSKVIELTADNPATLISTNSKDYSIFGLRLGMSRAEAEKILDASAVMVGVSDDYNPSRIYVHSRKPDGGAGAALLYLIWEPGASRLGHITVFQDFRERLTPHFRRLLSPEALDDSSPFKKAFIGPADRSGVTLDIRSIGLKHTTYFYDRIGLEVTDKHSSDGNEVVFALVETKPSPNPTRRGRKPTRRR